MRLSEVEPRDVRKFIATMQARGMSPNTVRLAVAPVRALLATAVEDGIIRSNPCAGIRLATTRPGDEEGSVVRALTPAEYARLIDMTPPEWRLLVRVLGETGMRIGEVAGLTWAEVDLGTRKILVRRRAYKGNLAAPKSRYGRRSIPVTDDLARALWTARGASAHTLESDPVFTSRTGRRIDPSNLASRVFKPAARAAGVDWAWFHSLRHYCATQLFALGLNAKQVQVWLGHHSPAFTLSMYVHLLSDELPESPFAPMCERTRERDPPARTDEPRSRSPAPEPNGGPGL